MLTELVQDFFVADQTQSFFGLEVGTRMSVMRLSGGDLLLHSPIHLDQELRGQLDALGRVRHVVAPNLFHHLYVGEYCEPYPEATCYCAPGLEKKRSDIRWWAVLCDEAEAAWAEQVDQLVFRGFPLANEVVFLHRASRSKPFSAGTSNVSSWRAAASSKAAVAKRCARATTGCSKLAERENRPSPPAARSSVRNCECPGARAASAEPGR